MGKREEENLTFSVLIAKRIQLFDDVSKLCSTAHHRVGAHQRRRVRERRVCEFLKKQTNTIRKNVK